MKVEVEVEVENGRGTGPFRGARDSEGYKLNKMKELSILVISTFIIYFF
jgi:hypothetical protein